MNTDHLDYIRRTSNERLIGYLDGMAQPMLTVYPRAEVESWTIQKTEAEKFLAAGEAATASHAPFLTQVCAAQFGPASDEDRLQQVATKAATVKALADAWAGLAAYVNGLRARTQTLFDAAATGDEVLEVLHNAISEAEVFRQQNGI